MDGDVLDVEGERSLAEISCSSGPFAGSLGGRVGCCGLIGTSDPASHLDFHRGLGIVLSAESKSVAVCEGSDCDSVDVPNGPLGGPVNGVIVEGVDGGGDFGVFSTVVGCGVSLAEEVVLYFIVECSEPFPIDLIKIIRLEDETTDDTGSWRCAGPDLDRTEEDILGVADSWCIGLGANNELGTEG